jgi:radical SAM superfamily enzyme YgiQ (UPF0313 family)
MKACICTTPIRPEPTDFPPLGSMAIISSLKKINVTVDFYNIDYFRYSHNEIVNYFNSNRYDIIAISAVVSTAYAYTKYLSKLIRNVNPETTIIVGGNLAASAEILLRKCNVDYCVIGDGELIIQNLVSALAEEAVTDEKLESVKGISFIKKDNSFIFTGYGDKLPAELIETPDFSILEEDGSLPYFIHEAHEIHGGAEGIETPIKPSGKKSMVTTTTKGCVARCTFCHRWEKGYRARPVVKVIEHIEEMKTKYDVGHFDIGDENFGSNRELTRELVVELGKQNVTWTVGGVRVRTVNKKDLQLWKDNGCLAVYFGVESGSPTMLNIMDKNATLEENINALKWTFETNISTIIQLVVGMPGENDKTIYETIDFLKTVSTYMLNWSDKSPSELISVNYAQALPGTPLYEYARENGYIGTSIDDEEEYLIGISDTDAYAEDHFLNYTGLPLLKVLTWRPVILAELDAHYARRQIKEYSLLIIFKYYFRIVMVRFNRRIQTHEKLWNLIKTKKTKANSSSDAEKKEDIQKAGYFNIYTNFKFAPLLMNPWTKKIFYPITALLVAFWRGKSITHGISLIIEHIYWSVFIKKKTIEDVPPVSLRKSIKLQKRTGDKNEIDPMALIRLGR